ncbi:hypothetical protein LOY42_23645 [Pseudomonas sp. B21-023]|uniref:hypothetical protein n=1 Tax=unclassified Pseudomonas TaxID=196821 RepID=UPI0015B2BF15|nr:MULTISPECIES: hypothetical protein [unclassified Pseudomonas]MBI6952570.1 hypothetical protein [Pseudomonas sp. CCOS 191]UVL18810.1 hypothetical protein LOY44_22945 [Pseudomonas sp. B21-044]UVM16223.1 hypothetical protein LOY42_23645 [Pseudomonas sp. B21-023]
MFKKVCVSCLLTDDVEGVALDSDGTCNLCRISQAGGRLRQDAQRMRFQQDLEATLRAAKGSGRKYDCIVSFSGGKDSCYLLHRLVVDYGLKVLAYTSDFDIPARTWDNIRRTVKALGVDHHVHRPVQSVYRRFIRHLLMNQGPKGAVHTVCYFWLDIREGDLLRFAVEKDIPLIFTGYSPGQPEPERMLYEMPAERIAQDWTPHELFANGVFKEHERALFWNPQRHGEGIKLPRILAPFHAWDYDQARVTNTVIELGLVQNKVHANPVLSNFTLNWLLMYSDLRLLGYNPYKPEFAKLVREGKAGRRKWLLIFALMDFMVRRRIFMGRHIDRSLRDLDLRLEDLKMSPLEAPPPPRAVRRVADQARDCA